MRRQGSLEMTIMQGRIEDSRQRGRANMRWMDCIKEAMHESTGAEQG